MLILGLILAGGQGRRLGGRDKAFVDLAGQPLLAHVLARFSPQVSDIAISANSDPARYAAFGRTVLADDQLGLGPLSGLVRGLKWAKAQNADYLATAAVDTPFFPTDLMQKLADATQKTKARATIARSETGPHPTFGVWHVSALEPLQKALLAGTRRLRLAADLVAAEYLMIDSAGAVDPFFNINTPEDLLAAEALAHPPE